MNSTTQTAPVQTADLRWLVGPEAADWLSKAHEMLPGSGENDMVRVAECLRGKLPAGRVHLILQQAQLREKGREKFPHARRMFFTPQGLQQATDAWIAVYKAARFEGGELIADLCCGIGGDLLALAQRGPVEAVERDPATAIFAEANVQVAGKNSAGDCGPVEVHTADVASVSLAEFAAWHIDPDRRPAGRRTTRVALHEPGPEVLARMLAACPQGAIKLAPAATFDEPWWAAAELEWISRGRECRQLVAWFGGLAKTPGRRRATMIRNRDEAESAVAASFVGEPNEICPIAPQIGRYVLEPDPAVLAAKLQGALAVDQGISAVACGVGYFTADRPSEHAALACFEVLDVMPYRIKALQQWLAARGIGRLEVKKRGVPLDPDEVRRQLHLRGDDEATLLLMPIQRRTTAILARRTGSDRRTAT